jgi:transcriptional regulator with XRE-family HTH domain
MTQERHLGEKIRRLRESMQMSVEELAERSQSSALFIEHIEAGELLPSLAPLMKIARALGVRLGTFLDDDPHGGPALVRGGRAESVVRFSGAGPCDQGELDFYSLAQHKKDRHMEPFLVVLHPKADSAATFSSHEGEEFLYVLDGAVEVLYGKEIHVLAQGDSIYYDSIVPHEVRAKGGQDARILAVVYAPF